MAQEYIAVRLSEIVRVAVPVADVEAVLQLHQQEICPIPGVNPCLLGVINQRGCLLWVLHFSEFLGLPDSSVEAGTVLTAVLIAPTKHTANGAQQNARRRVACVVAELEEIVSFDVEHFRPLPSNLIQDCIPFTYMAYKQGMPTMSVLDSSALFSTLHAKSSIPIPL